MALRIGVNLLAILPSAVGGIEFYVRNLLTALARCDRRNEYVLFTNRDNHESFEVGATNFRRVLTPVRARPQVGRILYEQAVLPVQAWRLKLDVLHSPTYTFPLLAPMPGTVTIHDMLYKVYPETIGSVKLAFWQIFVPLSAHRCQKVLTVSEAARRDIAAYLHIDPGKIVATPEAPVETLRLTTAPDGDAVAVVLARLGLTRPYLLCVGGLGLHKNSVRLVDVLENVRREFGEPFDLVITGNDYGMRRAVEERALMLGVSDSVHLPGYIAHADLPALYAGAAVYLSLSKFEGFGLTLLEAMAYGAPVVTSDRASLPEVAGDAALLVDPDKTEQVVEAVCRILNDEELREELRRRGKIRVRAFSWDDTARLTLSVYEEIGRKRAGIAAIDGADEVQG